jgi:hypothetical protein
VNLEDLAPEWHYPNLERPATFDRVVSAFADPVQRRRTASARAP